MQCGGMVDLAEHVTIRGDWRIIPANSLTAPPLDHGFDEGAKTKAREVIFVFLARALFASDMIPGAGLGGGAWIKDGRMHYYCPTSDFHEPADFMAEAGVVEDSGVYRLPVPLEELADHARAKMANVSDYEAMIAHALLLSRLFWDEESIWKGVHYGQYNWDQDTQQQREARYVRAKEVLALVPCLHTLGLVEINDTNGSYRPTPELSRISDLVV